MNFKLLAKTILVVSIKFGLFFGPSTQPVRKLNHQWTTGFHLPGFHSGYLVDPHPFHQASRQAQQPRRGHRARGAALPELAQGPGSRVVRQTPKGSNVGGLILTHTNFFISIGHHHDTHQIGRSPWFGLITHSLDKRSRACFILSSTHF